MTTEESKATAAPAEKPNEQASDEVVTLKKQDLLSLIEDERKAEASKHLEGFKKTQSERDRFRSERDEFKARAEASDLSPEDLAAYKDVRSVINDTAETIGETAGLTESQIALLKSAPTMKMMKAMAKEFQSTKPQSPAQAAAPANQDLLKRIEALGGNRGATAGNAGTQVPGEQTAAELAQVSLRGKSQEFIKKHGEMLDRAIARERK